MLGSNNLVSKKYSDLKNDKTLRFDNTSGWLGYTDKYWATAIIPQPAAPINATVRKVSAGAADRIPVVSATNLARCLRTLKDLGVWIYGLDGEAPGAIHGIDLTGNVALVMGGEGEGMRRLTRETCDGLVRIPMPGEMESLNVSVATGVALFEVVRQRELGK